MTISIVLIVIGFVLLIKGADWMVTGASALAKKYKVSDLVIGLTIVSFGTSAPELVVNSVASIQQHSDIVFGNILGCSLILFLYLLIFIRAFKICGQSRDLFGRLVCIGVIAWFIFQSFENIGMAMGLMPMTGVPLPFLSYGGSSMFANLIGIGLLQNVHARSR